MAFVVEEVFLHKVSVPILGSPVANLLIIVEGGNILLPIPNCQTRGRPTSSPLRVLLVWASWGGRRRRKAETALKEWSFEFLQRPWFYRSSVQPQEHSSCAPPVACVFLCSQFVNATAHPFQMMTFSCIFFQVL